MKNFLSTTFVALLLASGAIAQTHQHDSMPGMQMPQPSNPSQTQPSPPLLKTQQQATTPEPQQGMENMEMRNPEDITSNVAGVQEPENRVRKTGSNISVPDLLESARQSPEKTLDEFEALALRNNPTLKQAESMVRISSGLAHQSSLSPNPSVGYQGEQIRGGSFHGGEQGAFVQQDIVLGGKLRLRRNVFEQQRKADEAGVEEQKLSIRGSVQMQFYSALAQLRIAEIDHELLGMAMDAAVTAHQLANVGQADAPDVLQAEVEAEQAKLAYASAQREYIGRFSQLTAIVGDPQMSLTLLKGDLENSPTIEPDRYLQELTANSPTLKRAQQEASRAEAELARDRREAIPDLMLRAGAQQNREINDLSLRPVGAQAFATASIQIPFFNRNQGSIEASKAQVELEKQEVERVRLQLIQAAQPFLQEYLISKLEAERYKTQLIPRARRAYELYLQKYRNMAAAYPEVIVSQRTLFHLEEDYARALGRQWTASVQLQNYLLADGLSAPTSNGSARAQTNLQSRSTGAAE